MKLLLIIFLFVVCKINFTLCSEAAMLPIFQLTNNLTKYDCTIPKTLTFTDYYSVKRRTADKISTMTIYHYTAKKKFTYRFNETYNMITSSEYFDTSKHTVIFIRGFFGEASPATTKSMIANLKSNTDVNLLLLQNDFFMMGSYYYSSTAARIVGEALGELLAKLYMNGYGNFHVIGHSLGAQSAGFAGKTFRRLTSVNLMRISALDPAGGCFYEQTSSLRLDKNDADFVDVIHTNMDMYGINKNLGHVDFYPNGGSLQPNCFMTGCSHVVVVDYYSESIVSDEFIAVQCSNWDTFLTGSCINNNRVNMGYWTPTNARGVYYLETSDKSPYALGIYGITTA